MATCIGPECDREARAEELCPSHYRQALRCRERGEPVVLTPLRPVGQPLPQSFGVRVSNECRAALEAEAARRPRGTAAAVAREVLESWAESQPKPRKRNRARATA